MSPFVVPSRLLVAVTLSLCALPVAARGQEPESPPEREPPAWWLSWGFGLTDLGADHDAPGSLSSLRLERRAKGSVLHAETGIGFIDEPATCEFAGGLYECLEGSWWPVLGVGARLDAFSLFSTGRVYLIGQLGWQGTGLDVYADSGLGTAFQAVGGLEVGFELLTRYARSSGGGGDIYFFRVSRPLGGRDGDSGGEGSR